MNEQNARFGRDIVNELLADIKAYGVNSPCVLIFGRESGKLRDYEFKKEKVAFADEKHKGLHCLTPLSPLCTPRAMRRVNR